MQFESISIVALALTGILTLSVTAAFWRYLSGNARWIAIASFLLWLTYAGILGYSGAVARLNPIGGLLLIGPALAFNVAFTRRSESALRFATSVPLTALIGFQSYRIIVELGFHELASQHLMPRVLTFGGANFDMLIGVSAVGAAILARNPERHQRGLILWNAAGIASLVNTVAISVMTLPGIHGPIHAEVANRAIGMFPFTFTPGLFVPLALSLHVLSLRSLRDIAPKSAPDSLQLSTAH